MDRRFIALGGGGGFSGGAITSPIKAADGTVSAPSFSFSAETATGLYRRGTNILAFAVGGTEMMELRNSGGNNLIFGTGAIGFASAVSGNPDLYLFRTVAANLDITGGVSGSLPASGLRLFDNNSGNQQHGVNTEQITLSTVGTTTDSTTNLLPANSIILGVTARVTTTITTATSWALGDGSTSARFAAANTNLTAGTTSVGIAQWTGTAMQQVAAAKLRITTVGTPGAGVIRITVHYMTFTPSTS